MKARDAPSSRSVWNFAQSYLKPGNKKPQDDKQLLHSAGLCNQNLSTSTETKDVYWKNATLKKQVLKGQIQKMDEGANWIRKYKFPAAALYVD